MKLSFTKGIVIIPGLNGLSMQTLKIQDWTECSWRNNVHNINFSVQTCLEYGFALNTLTSSNLIFGTPVSLLQFIKLFRSM